MLTKPSCPSRPETAAAVSYLVQSLVSQRAKQAEPGRIHRAGAKAVTKPMKSDRDRMRTTIRVLDLCSGSGCISLLFWHEYYSLTSKMNFTVPRLEIVGLEASSEALELARENHASLLYEQSNCSPEAVLSLQQMEFIRANVLRREDSPKELLDLNTLRQVRFS